MYYPLIKFTLYSFLRGRPVQLSNISDSLGSVNYIIMSVFCYYIYATSYLWECFYAQ